MPSGRILARIDDMLAAIALIEEIAKSENWLSPVNVLAVERAIEIISEASRHIPDDVKGAEPTVRWRQVAGIGNVLRHDYRNVRTDIIANTIASDIPILKQALLRIRDTT